MFRNRHEKAIGSALSMVIINHQYHDHENHFGARASSQNDLNLEFSVH
jgi:hypothetical protein